MTVAICKRICFLQATQIHVRMTISERSFPGERQALTPDLNSQDLARSQEIRIIQTDGFGFTLFADLERFKQSPILKVMSVPGTVINSVQASFVDLK